MYVLIDLSDNFVRSKLKISFLQQCCHVNGPTDEMECLILNCDGSLFAMKSLVAYFVMFVLINLSGLLNVNCAGTSFLQQYLYINVST